MSFKQRRIVFYCLVVAFLFIGTGVALYAQGWRLDFKTFGVDKIGAIYVRSYPADAAIYLDDKQMQNKTGLFSAGTLLDGLFPRSYKLSLIVPGYLDWTRQIAVESSIVTKIEHAVLIPTQAKLVSAGPLRDFWLLGNAPLLQNTRDTLLWQGKPVPGDSVLSWNEDLTSMLTRSSRTGATYLISLTSATSTNLSATAQLAGLRNPSFILSPEDNPSILTKSFASLGLLNSRSGRFTLLATSTASEPVGQASASRFWLAWTKFDKARQASLLTLYDKLLGTVRTLNTSLPGKTKELVWGNGSTLGILQENGEVFTYFLGDSDVSHLASDGRSLAFAQGGGKLAVMENRALEVFSLNSKDYWRFNLPDTNKISGLNWYKDNFNLFVEYPDHVSFLGLEDNSLEAFQTVVRSSATTYEPSENKFYFLKDGALYALSFPS